MKPVALVRYIAWYATQNGIKLTTNRLVKFIYLADLYHARINEGRTITGFPWKFVHYGPYCAEAWESIESAAQAGFVCKETFDSKFSLEKDYSLFSSDDPEAEKLEDSIHIGVLSQLHSAIKKYGDDTPQLLDYVYFETEPMEGVKKGDVLDFSKARLPEPAGVIQLKKIPDDKIKLAREKIKLLGAQFESDREKLVKEDQKNDKYKTDSYYKFVKLLDGEPLESELTGTAKIKIDR
jgi:hypothetical protein